jgi:hypothetical protein
MRQKPYEPKINADSGIEFGVDGELDICYDESILMG